MFNNKSKFGTRDISAVKTMPRLVSGFTLLEIVIVVSLLALLLNIALPSFTSFRRNSLLNTETMELITLVNRARILSVSSKNDQQFGVHLETSKAVLFQGGTYDAAATTNETRIFGEGITLSSITVNPSGSDIIFDKVTGSTVNNATTTFLVTGTTASTTIIVYPTGIATIK